MVHPNSGQRGEVVYEYVWIIVVVAIIAGLSASMAYYGFARGFNPACKAYSLSEYQEKYGAFTPGVREVGPGVYEVNIKAIQFTFIPREIRLKDPVRVVFRITSDDVIHGFKIAGTSVNVMVFPGYVAEFVWEPPKDLKPGEYIFYCTEYCGLGHDLMSGKLIIEK